MRTLIVDDEPLARQRLRRLVEELPDYEVVGEAAHGEAALREARARAPGVVLLDIRMPGMDGMEAARHLQTLEDPPLIVFCTAFPDHALEAFETNAVDYLVKPVRRARLVRALNKARRLAPGELDRLARDGSHTRSHLCARIHNDLQLVPVDSVIYMRAEDKYVTVRHTDGELLIDESLNALEAEFGERFLRIHRNALVARAWLAGLQSQGKHQVVIMRDVDEALEVSRRNLAAVREAIKSL